MKQFTKNKRWCKCHKFWWQKSKRTHWVLLFIDRNTAAYFDSFRVEYIAQEVINKIKYKSIIQKIFRIQDDPSSNSNPANPNRV